MKNTSTHALAQTLWVTHSTETVRCNDHFYEVQYMHMEAHLGAGASLPRILITQCDLSIVLTAILGSGWSGGSIIAPPPPPFFPFPPFPFPLAPPPLAVALATVAAAAVAFFLGGADFGFSAGVSVGVASEASSTGFFFAG